MKRKELIKVYLNFFEKHNHKIIGNAPLIPEHDPTVLFTTAGMHPLVPFILGEKHPQGKRLANVQKCIRTGDIDSVGDEIHLTFFEMLGNWSLGDYFKKEAIKMSFEFLTKKLKIPIEKLAVSCFAGDKDAPRDEEAAKIWFSLGIPKERIVFLPKSENWWGPAGKTGPCGPDTEMFYWAGKNKPEKLTPENESWVEIWNDVFMQYNKTKRGFIELKQKNVDTGMGVERTIAVLQDKKSVYETEVFLPIIEKIKKISRANIKEQERSIRIIADHIKAACFILAENIEPSNLDRGYVLRRLIRRAIRHARLLGIKDKFTKLIAEEVLRIYSDYEHLKKNRDFIFSALEKEEEKFSKTLQEGLKKFAEISRGKKTISGVDAFLLYQSYGFPIEMTVELAKEKNLSVDIDGFEKENEKHQELSRKATEQKFKSGLADISEQTTKLHTATHLLHQALREVLGNGVHQKGSNITAERLRFDFSFDRKMTEDEIKKVEKIVNDKIKEALLIKKEEMTIEEAKKKNALAFFSEKYGEKVFVFSIGEKGKEFSKEVCAGPHVSNTRELGHFKIIKEEGIAAGVRRIKAVLE